jgi:GntR family transcriptional regulator
LLSRHPVSEQITNKLLELIKTGTLKPGDKLPSVRELSQTLTVSPNTVMKAFKALDSLGYIGSSAGIGTYVTDRGQWEGGNAAADNYAPKSSKESGSDKLMAKLHEAVSEMVSDGTELGAILKIVTTIYEEVIKHD